MPVIQEKFLELFDLNIIRPDDLDPGTGRENLCKQIAGLPVDCQIGMVDKIRESSRLRNGQIKQVTAFLIGMLRKGDLIVNLRSLSVDIFIFSHVKVRQHGVRALRSYSTSTANNAMHPRTFAGATQYGVGGGYSCGGRGVTAGGTEAALCRNILMYGDRCRFSHDVLDNMHNYRSQRQWDSSLHSAYSCGGCWGSSSQYTNSTEFGHSRSYISKHPAMGHSMGDCHTPTPTAIGDVGGSISSGNAHNTPVWHTTSTHPRPGGTCMSRPKHSTAGCSMGAGGAWGEPAASVPSATPPPSMPSEQVRVAILQGPGCQAGTLGSAGVSGGLGEQHTA